MEKIGELLALSNAILFAFSNIFNRRALDQMDKDSGMIITLMVNNLFNGIGMLVILLAGNWPAFSWQGVFWFVISGVATSYYGRDLLFKSVKINGPSKASTFKVTSPIFTLLIGTLILGEQVGRGSMIGALVCLLGITVVSVGNVIGNGNANNGKSAAVKNLTVIGVLIGLGSGLSFGIGMTTRKLGMEAWPFSLAGAFLGSMTAFCLTLFSFYFKGKPVPWRQMVGKRATNYVYSGICTGLAILCLFLALRYVTVTITNVVASLEPLFTIFLTNIMLRSKEKISGSLLVGAILVSLGVTLIFLF